MGKTYDRSRHGGDMVAMVQRSAARRAARRLANLAWGDPHIADGSRAIGLQQRL